MEINLSLYETVKDAAKRIGRSQHTIRMHVKRGRYPGLIHIGKTILLLKSEVDAPTRRKAHVCKPCRECGERTWPKMAGKGLACVACWLDRRGYAIVPKSDANVDA